MWKLRNIEIRNICTLKDVCYYFNQDVTTLVFGRNLDNEGQKNNGSGKSALIEAIVFGLTGSPLRQVKNDEIINNDEKEAYIKLSLENSSSNVEVEIERKIYKKGSPDITVTMYRDGKLVDDGTTSKSGVDEYNKYILELLGLTKDDIYNSYVLSKHKYQDFLSASDKDKKEIINRFSNGNLVDQSIAAVQADKKPIEQEFNSIKLELSNFDGRISAIEEQIATEQENSESRRVSKLEKIKEAKGTVSTYTQAITDCERSKITINDKVQAVVMANEHLNDIDDNSDNNSWEKTLSDIKGLVLNVIDYDIEKINQEKRNLTQDLTLLEKNIEVLEAQKEQCKAKLTLAKNDYETIQEQCKTSKDKHNVRMEEIKTGKEEVSKSISELAAKSREIRATIATNNSEISIIKAKRNGAIKCPHCSKEFVLDDPNFNVNDAEEEILTLKEENQAHEKEIEAIGLECRALNDQLASLDNDYNKAHYLLHELDEKERAAYSTMRVAEDALYQLEWQIGAEQKKVTSLRSKIDNLLNDMFEDLFSIISKAHSNLCMQLKVADEKIASYRGIISSSEELISKLESEKDESIILSLQDSLKTYRRKRAVVYKKHNDMEVELNRLNAQEARFVAFKTYLANSKVEALNSITNDFLEQIGSDLRVKFDGYTVLKSGKVRDKISVSLLRDGIDAGSFSKFSEGEKARIQLATILAMNTLTNNNADTDKGLDLLVLDEILAAVDEEGLNFILESLNKLHITSLVVSHGKTAESYPHQLLITKQNGVSRIGESHSYSCRP